jgi:hypothetical protein
MSTDNCQSLKNTKEAWYILNNLTCNEFIMKMLTLGKPIDVSLVGSFDKEGRGHRRDIELPLHRDGDYSAKIAKENNQVFDKKVDIVGLYCIKSGEAKTLIKYKDELSEITLGENQGIIFDNNECLHGRTGKVGDRVLLRIWVEKQ